MCSFAPKPLYIVFYVQTSSSKSPNLSKPCVGLHQILAICILRANLLIQTAESVKTLRRFASNPCYMHSTCKPPQTVNNFCLLKGKKVIIVWGSASFCRKEALQGYIRAKADSGILADLAWGVMGRGFVFLGMLAFAWKVPYRAMAVQKLTGVIGEGMKTPEKH